MRTFIIAEDLEPEVSEGSELVMFVLLGLGYLPHYDLFKFHLSAKLMVSFFFLAG